jgi:hypothetical protein
MKTSKMLQFICFLLIIVYPVFTQMDLDTYQKRTAAAQKAEQIATNLPSNEKKINSLILDKVNRMIDENAKTSYLSSEMVKQYSYHAARVDGEGRIKVKISMFENASKVDLNQLKSDLENLGVIKSSGYYPGPDVQWYPEIICFIPYEKIKDIAKDSRIANITVSSDPIFYAGSALTEGDSALFADVAREQHDVDGGRQHQVKVGVISDGIIGYDTSQANHELPYSLTWLQGHNTIAGKEGRAMLEIVHDLAPGADLSVGIVTHCPCPNVGTSLENDDIEDIVNTYPGPDIMYVDNGHPFATGEGTVFRPYNTVAGAINAVPAGGIVSIVTGSYNESMTINKALTLTAPVGTVIIDPTSLHKIIADGKKSDEGNLTNEFASNRYIICQNYPNPFNTETTIEYSLPKKVFVELKVYNILGQEVRTLVNEIQELGFKSIVWDGKNNFGESVTSGVYIYRFIADEFKQNIRIVILK